MPSSGFFNTIDSGSGRDDFAGSQDELWKDLLGLRATFAASPVQLLEPLPDSDPSFLWPQPSSPIYPPAHEVCFATAPPNPNPLGPFDFQSAQHYTPLFNPQDSGSMPTIMPTPRHPPAILNAGHSSMHSGFQGCAPTAVNGFSPVHDTFYTPENHFSPPRSAFTRVQAVQPHYNGYPMFVDQTEPLNSAMGTPYRQIQPALGGVTQNSSSIPSDLAFQPTPPRFPPANVPPTHRNSRGGCFVASSPYRPNRTSSLPIQAVSPKETALHTCEWVKDDGTICGAQITWTNVPEHLSAHGVRNLTHNHHLSCRWFGCRIRGDKATMNRESIVRHVREKHLGYRRTL